MPIVKMTIWPMFSQASDVRVLIASPARSGAMARSKRAASIRSLPKYLTVSKLSSESTAFECASWSDSFMVRRI